MSEHPNIQAKYFVDSKGLEVKGILYDSVGYRIPDQFIDANFEAFIGRFVWGYLEKIIQGDHFNPTSLPILVRIGRPDSYDDLVDRIRSVESIYKLGRKETLPTKRWYGLIIAGEVPAAV